MPRVRSADPAEVLRLAAEAARQGARVVLATVLARRGSTPSSPGQKLVMIERGGDRVAAGTVGGGAVEHDVVGTLDAWIDEARGGTKIETYKLGAELGMCCGGTVDVLFEAIASATPALLVGGGHIGSVTAPLLARCGFAVTLIDEREEWLDEAKADDGVERIVGDFELAGGATGRHGVVLAMTHDHQLDQRVIEWALRQKFAFVGGVGSRAKIARTRARLEAKGFSAQDVARVRMPIGLAIGARAPAEIAVSIVAELISWRQKGET